MTKGELCMTGNQYLDALQDSAVYLSPLWPGAYPYTPALRLCDAACWAAAQPPAGPRRRWLEGMAEGFAGLNAADGGQFARALACAARRFPGAAAVAAAQAAADAAGRGLPCVLLSAYGAVRAARDDEIVRTLGCFARRWMM